MTRTRQLRLNDPLQIRKRINEFLGRKINIVLGDNRVIIGVLEMVNEHGILLTNMRLKKVKFTFDELYEIYLDTIA